jgi:hypothetical protein
MIETVVHTINMGDVEDPDLFVASPIYDWQQTEAGKFIMEKSNPAPIWFRNVSMNTYGVTYTIVASLEDADYTYWSLKYK